MTFASSLDPRASIEGAALAAFGVTVSFGGVTALDNVSLALRPGEMCGVIGPNGAGKTTLFDVLSGIKAPMSGRIEMDGHDVTHDGAVRRARMGLRRTFQRQQAFGWLSVRDNVLVALEADGGGGGLPADMLRLPSRTRRERQRRARADAALELCGLSAVADESAGTLDIGRLRLVELARAVVAEPAVLLLDEPTSGLEARETEQLGSIIQALGSTGACAIAVVEHDVDFIASHCQRVVVLHLGGIIADGTPSEVRAMRQVQTAYLGEL
jgi:branched-chain amino acid transport system ATP-binding protein